MTTPRTATPTRRALTTLTVLAAALLVSACAQFPSLSKATPEEQVRQRANQRWQALMAKDFDKAYSYATASYRQVRTADYYKSKREATPVKWLSAEVVRVTCEAPRCTATVRIISKPMIPTLFKGNLDSGIDELWLLQDGQWWMNETL